MLPNVIKSGQLCTIGEKNILFGFNNIISSILEVKRRKSQACLLTLDFFKVYDRVLLDFLVKVMKRMNFGDLFTAWISMLHEGARTRFILSGLTRAIDLLFSIRQGEGSPGHDPVYYLYRAATTITREENVRYESC